VKPLSLLALSTLRALLPASIPLIGCGGISNADDALDFLDAGASIVQAYTAFGYTGVGFARQVKDGIAERLEERGTTWRAQVAANREKWARGVDDVERELRQEAARLKETLESLSLIPIEDLAAGEGVDLKDLSARNEDSTEVFGSMKVAAKKALEEARESEPETTMDRVLKPFMTAVADVVDRIDPVQDVPAIQAEPLVPEPTETTWRDTVLQGDRRLV
jgi:dihydroorotate dehydrogenase